MHINIMFSFEKTGVGKMEKQNNKSISYSGYDHAVTQEIKIGRYT